ncbi:MAG: dihydrodipicolinate synthase family protein [Bacteroidales bacterium]|jgi:4-hydroxy-2-oxoglutarate aldolase|nr:dihydrodipicolinate synthase family protein [Bacteroidales bacterium]
MVSLKGIFPPLPTSFDSSGELFEEKISFNIRKLSRFDLAGFLILGSNGELVMLSHDEKVRAYNAAREAIDSDRVMLAGTGAQSTRETILLTKEAARAGADAVLVLNPYYYKGLMTTEALKAHYHEVAEASTIPVIIYNMPANTGLDMTAEQVVAIASHPNIIGMKDSGGNIVKMGDIIRQVRTDFQFLAGSAGFLLPAFAVGAVGGILALANIAPGRCIAIHEAFMKGDIETARSIQYDMIPVNMAVTSRWGVPALKAAMDHLGLYGGPARSPIQPLKPETKDLLIQLLGTYKITL